MNMSQPDVHVNPPSPSAPSKKYRKNRDRVTPINAVASPWVFKPI